MCWEYHEWRDFYAVVYNPKSWLANCQIQSIFGSVNLVVPTAGKRWTWFWWYRDPIQNKLGPKPRFGYDRHRHLRTITNHRRPTLNTSCHCAYIQLFRAIDNPWPVVGRQTRRTISQKLLITRLFWFHRNPKSNDHIVHPTSILVQQRIFRSQANLQMPVQRFWFIGETPPRGCEGKKLPRKFRTRSSLHDSYSSLIPIICATFAGVRMVARVSKCPADVMVLKYSTQIYRSIHNLALMSWTRRLSRKIRKTRKFLTWGRKRNWSLCQPRNHGTNEPVVCAGDPGFSHFCPNNLALWQPLPFLGSVGVALNGCLSATIAKASLQCTVLYTTLQ